MAPLWSEKVKLRAFKNILATSVLIGIFSDRTTQAGLELAS